MTRWYSASAHASRVERATWQGIIRSLGVSKGCPLLHHACKAVMSCACLCNRPLHACDEMIRRILEQQAMRRACRMAARIRGIRKTCQFLQL